MGKLILNINDVNCVQKVAKHLLENELAIIPCDTIYGIVGVVGKSEHKLRVLKGRGETKYFIELVTLEMAKEIARSPIDENVLAFWPGRLTAIVLDKTNRTKAIRVPNDKFLLQILDLVNSPIYSTSVNLAGEKPYTDFKQMVANFEYDISLFVEGFIAQEAQPSTIIDITTFPYRLIRQGEVDVTSLLNLSRL